MSERKRERLGHFATVFAGGVAGCTTRAICQPLDVLKIRFQLQTEPLKAGSKYSSITQAIPTIIRDEGIATLWSGHVPAQCLSLIYGFVQFSCYEFFSEFSWKKFPDVCTQYAQCTNFISGSLAACCATVCSFPLDTARTRLIAEEKRHRVYHGLFETFYKMVKSEGFFALYRGLVPALIQIAPQAGIQYAVYKSIIDHLPKYQHKLTKVGNPASEYPPNTLTFVVAGSISGLIAKSSSFPLDLAKKRLQIQGFQKHRADFGKQIFCKTLRECLYVTWKNEGVLALYKGMSPGVIKAMVATGLQFTIYEELKILLLKYGF